MLLHFDGFAEATADYTAPNINDDTQSCPVLSIDFETKSRVDLPANGLARYVLDPSTAVYCMAYYFHDDGELGVWRCDEPFPDRIRKHVAAGHTVTAFNAQFEFALWNMVLRRQAKRVPPLRLAQVRCTAYQGRANGFAGGLDQQCRQLGLPVAKAEDGKRLIDTYSAQNVEWDDIPADDQQRWLDYCHDDVVVEVNMISALRPLSDAEVRDYHLIELINLRGVPVDVEFAEAALRLAEPVRADVNRKIQELTGGLIKKYTERKNRDIWLRRHLTDEQLAVITVKKDQITYTDEGEKVVTPVEKISFGEPVRRDLALEPELDPKVARFIELVDEGGGATISKYQRIVNMHVDGRMFYLFVGNAAHTGRQSSRHLQLQNLRRDAFGAEEAGELIEKVIAGEPIDDVTDTLARLIRAAVYSDDGLTVLDWSGIENAVLYWLADDRARIEGIHAGVDEYVELASTIYDVHEDDVDKDQRLVGKVGQLACNYAGGVGAIKGMARNFGVHMTEQTATSIRDAYRASHGLVQSLWYDLQGAAEDALQDPGVVYDAAGGKISYFYDTDADSLWCELPSGRYLRYYKPTFELRETPWGEERMAIVIQANSTNPKRGQREWPRQQLKITALVENVCQAIANDLLREAIRDAHRVGLPVIATVHDEVVVEGPDCTEALRETMIHMPDWADGIPLLVDGGFTYTYGK